jgi:Cys-tRNA(Pro)/Cys-tRNA(Cys) deacylase
LETVLLTAGATGPAARRFPVAAGKVGRPRLPGVASTPAVRALEGASVPHTLHPYDAGHAGDAGYGEAAAAALGADPRRLFKTLVTRVDGTLTVAVVPVSGSLDLKALATAAGGRKAVMADPADAERATGYVRGGISPLGQRTRLRTVVDSSALEFATVLVSAGRRGLQVALPPAELIRLTGAGTATIAR